MSDLLICGFSETITTGELKRDASARFWVESALSTLSRENLRYQVKQAFAAWSSVANVHGEEASSPDEAHLLVRVASIDGRSGVLADCMLPGPPVQLMRLDNAEQWTVHVGADVAPNEIDIVRVLAHELGHFWGLGHAPQGSQNLMAPMYSRTIWLPVGDWDLSNIVSLYGKPTSLIPAPGEHRIPSTISIFDQYGTVLSTYRLGERLA